MVRLKDMPFEDRAQAIRAILNRGVSKIVYNIDYKGRDIRMLTYATSNIGFLPRAAWPEKLITNQYYNYMKDEREDCALLWDYIRCTWVQIKIEDILYISDISSVKKTAKDWEAFCVDYRWVHKNGGYKFVKAEVNGYDTVDNNRACDSNIICNMSSSDTTDIRKAVESVFEVTSTEEAMVNLYKMMRSLFCPTFNTSNSHERSGKSLIDVLNEYVDKQMEMGD